MFYRLNYSMKVAHLILTHKNPAQLGILLDMLQHKQFDFYIHVDKKSNLQHFIHLKEKPNVFFVKNRVKIYWGDYGTIAATINGYQEILAGKTEYDYINVISGQDLPLKPPGEIFDFFVHKNGSEFITCEPVFGSWNVGPRVTDYHLVNWRFPGKYRLQEFLTKILPRRKFPFNYELVGRANWFTLTTDAVRYLLDFIGKNNSIVRYFKYCWGADEIMFPTILYNSPFKSKIVENLVYVDWSEGNAHPKLLMMEDYQKLKSSGKLFARKFDQEKDAAIIEKLRMEMLQF